MLQCPVHSHSFVLEYSYRGCLPNVKQQIGEMAINGSGIRDTARVLKISPTTVIEELKKYRHLERVNRPLLEQLQPRSVRVVKHVEEAEADEMWSFVRCKKQERWLWHAIDHPSGQLLVYVLAEQSSIACKTICFSKSEWLHDLVIG
jgi:insertion element IS1 protein InsB